MVKHHDTENKIFLLWDPEYHHFTVPHYCIACITVYTCTCIYNMQVQIWTQKLQPFKQGQQEEKLSPKHLK